MTQIDEIINHPLPLVGIVVVNWNREADTIRCLTALQALTYPRYAIVLIDNASTDGSAAAIHASFPDIPFLQSGENTGFTGGHNIGIRYFQEREANYILLLNNDAIIAPDALTKMVDASLARPDAGFVGARICVLEEPSVTLSAGGVLEDGWHGGHLDIGQVNGDKAIEPVAVDYVSGCAVMISQDALEHVGLLDDDLFAYYEDVEWCYRGQRLGYASYVVQDAIVLHPDTRARDQNSTRLTYYTTRNSLLFAHKHQLALRKRFQMWLYYGKMWLSWRLKPRWRHKRSQRIALGMAMRDYVAGRFGRNDAL